MTFKLCTIDWTAIAAIANFIMIVVSFLALRRNKQQIEDNREQFKELKRQWDVEHSPKMELKLIDTPFNSFSSSTSLQLYNYGKSTANNIKITFDEDFISGIKTQSFKNYLKELEGKFISVLPERTIIIPFCELKHNENRPGYLLYGQELTLDEVYSLLDYLKPRFKVYIDFDGNHKPLVFELSYDERKQRESSIQEELSYIQLQLGLLRTDLNSANKEK